MIVNPPKWADRFLRWYCDPRYLEEIEGDIYELFDRRVETQSSQMARLKFIWDVFRFLRWSNIKRANSKYTTMNHFMLFSNYLKLGMRNIRKNLVSSSINILGMAIAICFAISIFIFTDVQLNMDAFHSKADRIYQITNYVDQEGNEDLWSDSPIMLAPALKEDHPSIESFARIEYRNAVIKFGSDVFDELVVFTDPAFFEMFDFEMIEGERGVLKNKSQVVISKKMAIKYFENEDPIGQELSFKFANEKTKRLIVGAVLEEYPYNASIGFNFYISMDNFKDLEVEDSNEWSYMTDANFIMLREGENIGPIVDSFDRYIEIQHGSNPEWKIRSFVPLPLKELSLKSYMIVGSVSGGGHPAGRVALLIIAAFLLGMACFNFMNISVVSASKRLKEIALRKVMGSVRKEIIFQFMTENLLKCFFALVVGALLSYFLLIPWFDIMIPEMDVQFRTHDPLTLVYFMLGLLFVVGIISGAYPAFYISKFDTITIFKGKEKFGSKNLFSKVMLGLQFFLAVMTIVGCFIMTEQSIYLGEKDWGYDPQGTMSVYVNSQEQFDLLKKGVVNHPAVMNHTSSDLLLGRGITKVSLEMGDKQIGVRRISASAGYFDTFQLRIKEGRALSDRAEDQKGNVVVNEKFIEVMGWESGLGKTFTYDSMNHTIVGVVENFHYYDFFSAIDPVMIRGLAPERVRYLSLQTKPENLAQLEQFTRNAWQEIAPNDPFDRVFQEDVFDGFYQENQSNIIILMLVTGIAIVLACLGLYGLLSFNVQGKLKEFSVRKVLGADPRALVKIISKQYFWVLLISFLIGAPLGSMGMMNLVVNVFPDPKAVSALPFIVAIVIILITLIITVAGQINKAIKVNPAELLRSE